MLRVARDERCRRERKIASFLHPGQLTSERSDLPARALPWPGNAMPPCASCSRHQPLSIFGTDPEFLGKLAFGHVGLGRQLDGLLFERFGISSSL